VLDPDSDAICATLCTTVLPVSHCVNKVGGQVPITQQSRTPIFGTTVQSDHEEADKLARRDA
jgi:hypothetical protein